MKPHFKYLAVFFLFSYTISAAYLESTSDTESQAPSQSGTSGTAYHYQPLSSSSSSHISRLISAVSIYKTHTQTTSKSSGTEITPTKGKKAPGSFYTLCQAGVVLPDEEFRVLLVMQYKGSELEAFKRTVAAKAKALAFHRALDAWGNGGKPDEYYILVVKGERHRKSRRKRMSVPSTEDSFVKFLLEPAGAHDVGSFQGPGGALDNLRCDNFPMPHSGALEEEEVFGDSEEEGYSQKDKDNADPSELTSLLASSRRSWASTLLSNWWGQSRVSTTKSEDSSSSR